MTVGKVEGDLAMALIYVGFRTAAPPRWNPEPAGLAFESNVIRDLLAYGCSLYAGITETAYDLLLNRLTGRSIGSAEAADSGVDMTDFDADNDPSYVQFLSSLDPTKWKEYDQYRVLGLSKLRYRANFGQIRCSYRQKVLKFHPDKCMAASRDSNTLLSHDAFACITRAYETLSSPLSRRSYDSVDPMFDERVPAVCTESRENFYEVFGAAFERNARWSTIPEVPLLGGPGEPEKLVDAFYSFWYSFPSWREFSWYDEEDTTKATCREERRWMEKCNKAARDSRRKEEMKRIRLLVENAYKCDPRVQKFKEEEKKRRAEAKMQKRLAKQQSRQELLRRSAEEEEQARREKMEKEERERQRVIEEKRKKLASKKLLQKERKALWDFVQCTNYFGTSDAAKLSVMENVGRLCTILPIERLEVLNQALRQVGEKDLEKALSVFTSFVDETNQLMLADKLRHQCENDGDALADSSRNQAAEWTKEETQLLVRAMSLFPTGSKNRWDTIAEFINEHKKTYPSAGRKTSKQVATMVKHLERTPVSSAKEKIVMDTLLQAKGSAQVEAPPSVRYSLTQEENAAEENGGDGKVETERKPWTAVEQKQLEAALKQYPSTLSNRWDLIADQVPTRSKAECIHRYKEIAELLRARKSALQKSAPFAKQR